MLSFSPSARARSRLRLVEVGVAALFSLLWAPVFVPSFESLLAPFESLVVSPLIVSGSCRGCSVSSRSLARSRTG